MQLENLIEQINLKYSLMQHSLQSEREEKVNLQQANAYQAQRIAQLEKENLEESQRQLE